MQRSRVQMGSSWEFQKRGSFARGRAMESFPAIRTDLALALENGERGTKGGKTLNHRVSEQLEAQKEEPHI